MTDHRSTPTQTHGSDLPWRGRPALALAVCLLLGAPWPTTAWAAGDPPGAQSGAGQIPSPLGELLLAQRRTCKSVSSCEEAVRLWCGGYSRADGDNDGIPCENVCHSKREVDAIRAQIGC
ncbi:excalibur calcium-binding domain-containing protein [Jiella avicenniae]|uniref:Excalibur calcium-binding domain-containing protein n=1 Tax=Jiella avicenniae TaxID=2907202 RepID=A0A9X1T9J1_9HYPH|nr:excalibur calcium-binding domain-containing protein [Jiella avicenniae]MCE7026383.1 excalibur calcium-binding domain-containing protein [Jiella avicenniae]